MRTLLLVLLTIAVIAVGAGVYVWLQPATAQRTSVAERIAAKPPSAPPAAATSPSTDQSLVHAGTDVWVETFDEKTAQVASRFKVSRYDPQPDGTVNVTNPQAEFLLTGGQMVRIEGTYGKVVMPADAAKTAASKGPNAPPSRGELYNVTISQFPPENHRHAVFVCKVNNMSFDNDTFRIATEAFTKPDGTLVPADQVPVQVRGDDYDFDGRGLTIRWNDRDRRLGMLEIAHGESLTIKSPQVLQGITPAKTTSPPPARSEARPTRNDIVLAEDITATSRRPASPGEQQPAEPTTHKSTTQPVYRATFDGGVKVTQGDQPLASAEVMRVDFKGEESGAPTTAPIATTRRAVPTTRRATTRRATPAEPTTPAEQPVVIRWPGKLVVVPVEKDPPRLSPGQRNVEMISNSATPVVLDHAGSQVKCASFLYGGGDDSLLVRSSEQIPMITMKDAAGATLFTPSLNYTGSTGKAVLDGASHAQIPVKREGHEDDPNAPTDLLTAKWSQSCVLSLTGQTRDQMTIDAADLTGDVNLDHPQMKLASDTLHVAFEPAPTTQPSQNGKPPPAQPKDMTATGNVKCDLIDEQQRVRHITTDRLVVATEKSPTTGKMVPHAVTADGNVHTFDEEQDLKSQHLLATLAPTTRPTETARIESFFAQQDVEFATKDTSGTCDQLIARANGDDFDVKLSGQPFATVKTQKSTLVGPIINVQPKRQNVQVVGAGSLSGVQQPQTPDGKATPFDVTWQNGMDFQGSSNRATVTGAVVVSTASSDGALDSATGDRLTLALMDDPTAATQPSKPGKSTTAPADPLSGDFQAMSKKVLKSISFEGGTEVKSVLSDANGLPLRRLHLFAPTLNVDAETKLVTVPSAGRMLYEDRRSTTQPTTAPTTAPSAPLGDLSGATAFQWAKQLTYDQNVNRAEMLGDVLIVHQETSGGGEPFRLEAQKVAADMEPPRKDKSKATTKPLESGQKIKMLTASEGVHFASRNIQFDADNVRFDPVAELLIARGSDRAPVQVYDEKGMSGGTFEEIWWNTRTQQIVKLHNVQAQIRR